MAPLADLHSKAPIKLLFIGNSGVGKTGALASLAARGYNLRILDIDKGVDVLGSLLTRPDSIYFKADPHSIDRVNVIQCSDSMKAMSNGALVADKVQGWARATNALTHWKDGESDLGPVTSWGPKDVLVIDSLSGLTKLALRYHLFLNAGLYKTRTQNEARRDVGAAQNYIRDLLDLLYDDGVKCNVIVISHVTAVTEAGGAAPIEDGKSALLTYGHPSAIGRALSPHIPRWFNNMLVVKAVRNGTKVERKIFTSPQEIDGALVVAKTSAPGRVKDEYPLEWGLADFFADVKGTK
jgi:hypothetical protein